MKSKSRNENENLKNLVDTGINLLDVSLADCLRRGYISFDSDTEYCSFDIDTEYISLDCDTGYYNLDYCTGYNNLDCDTRYIVLDCDTGFVSPAGKFLLRPAKRHTVLPGR